MVVDKAYALTTRQRVIDYMELTNLTDAQNDVLDRLIEQVTEFIENYCNRRFKQTSYSNEEYEGTDSSDLFLRNYPVDSNSTFTLQVRTSAVNEDEWDSIDSEDYFVNYDAGIVVLAGGKFLRGYRKYRVTYTAGYDFDNSSTFLSDTEGGDVELVAWEMVKAAFSRRKGDSNIESESLLNYSVTYRKTLFENEALSEILDKYRRVPMVGLVSPRNT